MIVSCHVPKTAGTTFRTLLREQFGAGLHLDYGDRVGWTGPEADEWRRGRGVPAAIAAAYNRGAVRIVHGHFYASKYATAYPEAQLVTFLREPVYRVASNYQYLSEHPEIDHPLVSEFHRAKPSLSEWAEWPWARNLQRAVLDVQLERFALIGITEQLQHSLLLFDANFGTSLAASGPTHRYNTSKPMVVEASTRMRIRELNADDLELYRKALARFERDVAMLDGAVHPLGTLDHRA